MPTTISTPTAERSASERPRVVPSGSRDRPGTIWVLGEVDAQTAPDMRRQLCALLFDRSPGEVVLDLSRVGFLDTAGVRTLTEVSAWSARRGLDLVIGGISPCAAAALAEAGSPALPASTPVYVHGADRRARNRRSREAAAVTLMPSDR